MLVEELSRRLQDNGIPDFTLRSAMERLQEQNFRIQARITVRKDRTAREMKNLFDISRRKTAYNREPNEYRNLKRKLNDR